MTLRARLAWTYGAAVFVAVVLLAIASIAAIDRSLRTTLDERLSTAALAVTGLVDVHDGRLSLDAEDRRQLTGALGNEMDGAVIAADGRLYTASAASVPQEIASIDAWSRASRALYTVGRGEHALRVAVAPVTRGGTVYGSVVVWKASDYIDEFDRNAIVAMALSALLIGGIVVVLSSTLARRALAPLERFTELATEIEAHDLSRRVGGHDGGELGTLASAFDRMLDRLQAAFGRQRKFTADASHELRAPLAVIRAEADVALAKERSPDEYRTALQTIVHEVDRLDALVDALLVAARADSSRLRMERIDAGALVLLVLERFRPAAQARSLEIEAQAAEVETDGDAHALERALAAVVHNAIDFAAARVIVCVESRDACVEITIRDDGPGFSAEGLRHATERFWRADQARGRGGTGLGLSIAETIVRAHGGTLQLANSEPRGACVTLRLPFIGASSEGGILSV